MIKKLGGPLEEQLRDARELYIAVALMKDYGLNLIERTIPKDCECKYLVGIYLPTAPSVLRKLLDLSKTLPSRVEPKIYEAEVFHPKVYIIRKKNNKLVVFIGSANATYGGFNKNVEFSVVVEDQASCDDTLQWFVNLFKDGVAFDKPYIDKYELTYRKNRVLDSIKKSNTDKLVEKGSLTGGVRPTIPVEQFFRQSDFDAFAPIRHLLSTPSAKKEKKAVRERLLELHDAIVNKFTLYGIDNLNTPLYRLNYTSQWFHSRGYSHIPKEAIWLHYGKSNDELNKYTTPTTKKFVHHIRIQVILRNTIDDQFIGVWLYIGDPDKSWHDRNNLLAKLNNIDFLSRLYEYILKLGDSYWISIGTNDLYISDLKDEQQLFNFLSNDDFHSQYIIGRNYLPDNSALSESNIFETTLIEFSKLYKIYDLIKDR